MHAVQIFLGVVIVLLGVLLLGVTSGLLAFTPLDIAGSALILSGLFFWIPGIALRKRLPWLTALFIPGALAFATGALLIYAGRFGFENVAYLWTVEVLALGIALLAMDYLGMPLRVLRWLGAIIGGTGAFLLALFLSLYGNDPLARTAGPLGLIALGALLAVGALVPRR